MQQTQWWADWEELVDGELDLPRQSALFEEIDRQPGAWKTCALWLLAEMRLQRQLRAFVEASRVDDHSADDHSPTGRRVPVLPASRAFTKRFAWQRWSVAVALVVLAFTVGWVSAMYSARTPVRPIADTTTNPQTSSVSAVQTLPQASSSRTVSGENPIRSEHVIVLSPWNNLETPSQDRLPMSWVNVYLPDPVTEHMHPLRVPVWDISNRTVRQETMRQESEGDQNRWEQFVKDVNQQGGTVHRTEHWIAVDLDGDRYALIPVENWELDLPAGVSLTRLLKEVQP